MTTVLNIVLLVLVGLSVLAGLYFIAKGFGARSSVHRQAYSVGQTEARRMSRVNWIRGLVFFALGLVFLGMFALIPFIMPSQEEAIATEPTAAVTLTLAPVATAITPLPTAFPSPTVDTASPTPEPTAAPTDTPAPQTAVVSSGVGVWLRGAPSTAGQQLEWLLDGTVVVLLPQQQTADDLVWQQVQTEDGQVGWVAFDFLAIGEPTPVEPPPEVPLAAGESTPEPSPEP